MLADRNVEWRGVEEFSPLMPGPSVVLFWREPRLLLDPAVQQAPYTKVLWLHDTGYGAPPEAYYAADVVAVVSEAHIDVLCAEEKLDKSRVNFLVLGNGIDGAELAAVIGRHLPRDPLRVVYGSSPDRGLIDLLTIWPEVVKQVPGAHLDVYYSWDMARARNPRLVAELEELLARCGDSAVHHGGVDHQTLHEAYAQAGVWAYPTDFFEVSCITAMKVQALGCWPLTRAVGALPETLAPALEADPTPGAVFVESATGPDGRLDEKGLDAFRDALIARLRAPATENVRSAMQAAALGRFLWAQTAERLLGTLRAVRRDVAQRADERRKAWPAVAPLPPEGPASRR